MWHVSVEIRSNDAIFTCQLIFYFFQLRFRKLLEKKTAPASGRNPTGPRGPNPAVAVKTAGQETSTSPITADSSTAPAVSGITSMIPGVYYWIHIYGIQFSRKKIAFVFLVK